MWIGVTYDQPFFIKCVCFQNFSINCRNYIYLLIYLDPITKLCFSEIGPNCEILKNDKKSFLNEQFSIVNVSFMSSFNQERAI